MKGACPSADVLLRNPITGIDGRCARAANGQTAAAAPISVINSRRFIGPSLQHRASSKLAHSEATADIAVGSIALVGVPLATSGLSSDQLGTSQRCQQRKWAGV